jgi:hypothetical protein
MIRNRKVNQISKSNSLLHIAELVVTPGLLYGALGTPSLAQANLGESSTAASMDQVTTVAQMAPVSAQADLSAENASFADLDQVTSVSQLTDVRPTDWAFQALQSLVERYGCIVGYPDKTYRGNRALSRYEFAAGVNACLDRINELLAAATADLVRKEDLVTLQKLQEGFAAELATLRGRVDSLEVRTRTLEAQQFSTTTKLNAQSIWAISDTFGNRVGRNSDDTNPFLATRTRLNFESSFSGKDLLRVRLEFGNFVAPNGTSRVAALTGTNMTRLNFDNDFENQVFVPHIRYYFPVSDAVAFIVGPTGIGFTDITDTLTPPSVADDGLGIPSQFGEYSPFYRRGGGGGALNWNITKDIILTAGYLAFNPDIPLAGNGLFNGGYNAMAQLAFYGNWGAIGVGYTHSYAPSGKAFLGATTGSLLANLPFGTEIPTSADIFNLSGFYKVSNHFNIHAFGGYISANAEDSGLSNVSNGRGGTDALFVADGDHASAWYAAVGLTFPDVGGKGNMPGLLVGAPPTVSNSDVRSDRDIAYHVEAFYRIQINDNIAVTPGFWVIFNPEDDSRNDTQYVGVLRTTFNF